MKTILFFSGLCMLSACSSLKESAKYAFKEGWYTYEVEDKRVSKEKQYVVVGPDTIKVYSPEKLKGAHIDTVKAVSVYFPSHKKPMSFKSYEFRKTELDLDVISVIMKYRPSVSGFPNELTTSWNGAFYTGLRSDVYRMDYHKNPLGVDERDIMHFGYSVGVFAGIGTSHIDEWVTLNRLDIEYEGFIGMIGVGGFIGIDRINFGLCAGMDYLFDKNRDVWIYNLKPWFGLALGLNIQKAKKGDND